MYKTIFSGTVNTEMTPVSVIASFDAEGNILPLYLGYKGESYKVVSAIFHPEIKVKIFECKINVYGRTRDVMLSFHPDQNIWTIPRQFS